MDYGELNRYFDGAGSKFLTPTEIDGRVSHQHEFQGVGALRSVLGLEERRGIPARFLFLEDDSDPVQETGFISWTNVRRDNPNRSPEYHVYYSGALPTRHATPGDRLVIAQETDGSALVLIAKQGSTVESQVAWLFGFEDDRSQGCTCSTRNDESVDALGASILELIGIEVKSPREAEDYLDDMLTRFPDKLPSCAEFSAYARSTLSDIDFAHDDPDSVILACYDREEMLFKTYEKNEVSAKLAELTNGDLDPDAILNYSKSVFNRRKARAGKSLENHLAHIFVERRILFTPQAKTEEKSTADFIFPSIESYKNASFPSERLTVLGAKTSLKDRWRQVLDEASRIPDKHLITLDPAVSVATTEGMRDKRLQLVVPKPIHSTYKPTQQEWLWTLERFCDYVKEKQGDRERTLDTLF